MTKQVVEADSIDRISGLPEHILHHILSFLSKKDAARTCVLSKSWGYFVSTRPIVEFRQPLFKGDKHAFMSFLDKTLQRYHDRKLSITNFVLETSSLHDSKSISLIEKWIPIVLSDMGVKTFTLSSVYIDPRISTSLVFKAESLEELDLCGCKLAQNPLDKNILLKHLQKLSLNEVDIDDETFHNIISACPLIANVTLRYCYGLRTITMNKAYNLKHFDFQLGELRDEDHSIEIDVPTIETIRIVGFPNWYHHHNYFPHLKSLYLNHVQLSKDSFDIFSCNCPCLQVLTLHSCYGFEEIRLVSPSIKHFTIDGMEDRPMIKLAIDAPNIIKFDYGGIIPQSISFTTTFSEWRSNITLWLFNHFGHDASSWLRKLHEFLKALSQSEISLDLFTCPSTNEDMSCADFCEPLYVENLRVHGHYVDCSSSSFIDNLLRIFHPRDISHWFCDPKSKAKSGNGQFVEFMWKVIIIKRQRRDYVWKNDLEEVSVEAFDENEQKWDPVVGKKFRKCDAILWAKYEDALGIRFRFKWRR